MSLLTTGGIRARLGAESCMNLDTLEVFSEIDSTNNYLLEQPAPSPGRYRIALAEYQTAGRGRQNRHWISPPSSGLCLSMAYTFQTMPEEFPSLSLAIGAGVAQSLENLRVRGVCVKWPNDIVSQGGKLGGVLSEVRPTRVTGVTVIVGIGLNVDFRNVDPSTAIASRLGRAVDLASCCDNLPSRDVLAAAIIDCLFDTLLRFEERGFAAFHETWQKYDWLRGQEVTIETAAGRGAGIADGVDVDGALLLKTEGNRLRFTSGSVILGRHAGENP